MKRLILSDLLFEFASRGIQATDTEEERFKKCILTIIALVIAVLALLWGSLYMASGYPLSGVIPLSYAAISFISIAIFFRSKHFAFFRFSQLLLILLLPFILMWSLGGFANGSAVMIWAIFAPLAALFFSDNRSALLWLLGFLLLTVFSALMDSRIASLVTPMERGMNTLYFLMNLGMGVILIFIVLHFFVRERDRANRLAVEANENLQAALLELQENQSRIHRLMLTDPLTGVANRRHLDQKLQEELNRAQRYQQGLAIIMTDIDDFKHINDHYGHPVGDQVIQLFAGMIQKDIRNSDFVARIGGEEFIILLPNSTAEDARQLAERIRTRFYEQPLDILDEPLSASFGVITAQGQEGPQHILVRVDKALYAAKQAGKNCVSLN